MLERSGFETHQLDTNKAEVKKSKPLNPDTFEVKSLPKKNQSEALLSRLPEQQQEKITEEAMRWADQEIEAKYSIIDWSKASDQQFRIREEERIKLIEKHIFELARAKYANTIKDKDVNKAISHSRESQEIYQQEKIGFGAPAEEIKYTQEEHTIGNEAIRAAREVPTHITGEQPYFQDVAPEYEDANEETMPIESIRAALAQANNDSAARTFQEAEKFGAKDGINRDAARYRKDFADKGKTFGGSIKKGA